MWGLCLYLGPCLCLGPCLSLDLGVGVVLDLVQFVSLFMCL